MSAGDLSVVVPAHNASATLRATVESVLQADGLLEIVVVDDGSTDDTLALANKLAVDLAESGRPLLRVLTQAQAGPSEARNHGVASAQGPLLAFLDADDIWLAGRPDSRRAALGARPAIALGLIQHYAGDPAEPAGEPFEGFQVGAALVSREVFELVGPFEPAMRLGEDVDWFLRAREAGVTMVFTSEVVLAYQTHAGSLSARRAARGHGLLDALHRSVERRRTPQESGA